MNKDDFAGLTNSIREAGQIRLGLQAPARETIFTVTLQPSCEMKAMAVCVKTDDPVLLIPHNLYAVTLYDDQYVRVIDEAGEAAIYPSDFFSLLNPPPEVATAMDQVT